VELVDSWAERLSGTGVTVNAMHPGWVDTPGLRDSLPRFYRLLQPFLRTPEQGADTILWLAAAKSIEGESGAFWLDRLPRSKHKLKHTVSSLEERDAYWEKVEALADSLITKEESALLECEVA
jgi:GTPase Era involved in 16S rRNA processing